MFNLFKKQHQFQIHSLKIGDKYYEFLAKQILKNNVNTVFGKFNFILFLSADLDYILYIAKHSSLIQKNFSRAFLSKAQYINDFWINYQNQNHPDYSFETALEKIYTKYLNKYMNKNKAFSTEKIFITELEKQIDKLEFEIENIENNLKSIIKN